jgi:7-cyano-7-deazaguanine synthase in queuosine biosynthesis
MSNPTHLLWTGGWDSTFRLLQLLFVEKKVVKPHYIVTAQECVGKEIDTISKICRKISRQYSEQGKLLLPITYTGIGEIKNNKAITEEYKKIAESQKINQQYEFLARYCEQIGVSSMDLGILSNETFDDFITNITFFKYFEFPLLGLTKSKMEEIAKKNGWTKLMKMTWFCRRPKNGRPCGICGPCTDVAKAGMGWRLPLKARIIANIQLPFRKWWRNNYQKQNKGILKYVPKIMKDMF